MFLLFPLLSSLQHRSVGTGAHQDPHGAETIPLWPMRRGICFKAGRAEPHGATREGEELPMRQMRSEVCIPLCPVHAQEDHPPQAEADDMHSVRKEDLWQVLLGDPHAPPCRNEAIQMWCLQERLCNFPRFEAAPKVRLGCHLLPWEWFDFKIGC